MYVYNNSIFRAQSLIRFESLFGGGAGESGAELMRLSCRGADWPGGPRPMRDAVGGLLPKRIKWVEV
jgi:hypothetical protein